jgi:hypothetical protein
MSTDVQNNDNASEYARVLCFEKHLTSEYTPTILPFCQEKRHAST